MEVAGVEVAGLHVLPGSVCCVVVRIAGLREVDPRLLDPTVGRPLCPRPPGVRPGRRRRLREYAGRRRTVADELTGPGRERLARRFAA